MKSLAASLLHLLAVLAALSGAAIAAEGTLVTGTSRVTATLRSVKGGDRFIFDVAGEARTVAAADIVSWGSPVESSQGVQVVLDRGGLLIATEASLSDEALDVAGSLLWGESRRTDRLNVPLAHVAGVLFEPSSDTAARDRLLISIASSGAESERMFLANGDELLGTIVELSPHQVEFESNVGVLEVELAKVAGVSFDPALRAGATAASKGAMVGLSDGTRLHVASLTADDKVATLRLDQNTVWHVDTSEIIWLLPARENVAWLSDIEPSSYRHLPFLDLAWPYQLDQSVAGGMLRSGGQLYLKGVGLHSTARLSWDLDQPWRRFEADIALDDSAGNRGSVVFRVFTDGEEAYASPVVRGGDPSQPVSVDISGAKRLSLIVDFADRGDELDHADWLNARLVR